MRPFSFYLNPGECKERTVEVTEINEKLVKIVNRSHGSNTNRSRWRFYLIKVEDTTCVLSGGVLINSNYGIEICKTFSQAGTRISYVFPVREKYRFECELHGGLIEMLRAEGKEYKLRNMVKEVFAIKFKWRERVMKKIALSKRVIVKHMGDILDTDTLKIE